MSAIYPTPHTLAVRTVTYGPDRDTKGNLVRHVTEHPWPVYLIHAGAMRDSVGTVGAEPNRDASTIAYTIGAPETPAVPTKDDEVQVDGRWLRVNGTPKNRNRGPFGFTPGVMVELLEVTG